MYMKTGSIPPLKCLCLTLSLKHSKSVFFSLAQAVGFVLLFFFLSQIKLSAAREVIL